MIIALISACILTFAANNVEAVTLSLFPLPYEVEVPVFLLALICFACGVIIGGMLLSVQAWKWRNQARRVRKRVEALENEIAGIQLEPRKNLPVAA